MENREKLKLKISASRVGGHYEHGCERYTAYSILSNPEKVGWSEREFSHTSSQDAGHIWEWDALCLLEERGIPCYAERKKRGDDKHTEQVKDFREMRSLCNVYEESADYLYADLSAERTIEILRDPSKFLPGYENEGGYIYQTKLLNQPTFTKDVLLSNKEYHDLLKQIYDNSHPLLYAEWSFCKPDLILVKKDKTGENVFSVIDVKHAKHARMAHKVQVAIYAIMLDTLLREEGIPGRVDMENGYLWNFKREEPVRFDMSIVMPYVERYFKEEMPEAIVKLAHCLEEENVDDLYNHAFPALPTMQCEWCENFESCMKYQKEHEPVTLMPFLSYYAQVYAKAHNIPLGLDEFENYISDEHNLTELKEGCLGWKRVLRTADENLRALRIRKEIDEEMNAKTEDAGDDAGKTEIYAAPVGKNVSSLVMPAGEKVRIILTAQRDEATDRMYALGINASTWTEGILPEEEAAGGEDNTTDGTDNTDRTEDNTITGEAEDIPAEDRPSTFYRYENFFIAESPEELDGNIRAFLECLYDILQKCDEYNRVPGRTMQEQLTVQAYVMDSYEQMNIREMVLDELLNGDGVTDMQYREKLLAIQFWLMGEKMVTDIKEQAGGLAGDFPLVVLSGVIKTLFSIPAFISYDLETVCDSLLGSDTNKKEFMKYDTYNHLLSNTMKSDAINRVWANKVKDKDEEIRRIRMHLGIRLRRERRIVDAIRKKSGGMLKRWPEAFALAGVNDNLSIRAAKLLTEHQYEELLSYHDMRQIRMNDLEEMAEEGRIMKVRLIYQEPVEKPTYYYNERLDGYKCECEIINKDVYFQSDLFRGIMLKVGDTDAWEELCAMKRSREEDNVIPNVKMDEEYRPIKRLYVLDKISSKTDDDGRRIVSFERFKGFDEVERGIRADEETGTEFYLVDSYKDLNGGKVIDALREEGLRYRDDEVEESHSLLYPESIYREEIMRFPEFEDENLSGRTLTEADLNECLTFKPVDGGKDFTASQKRAFRQMFFRNITLLLGPPGTGKTDYIARAIITICKYYASKGVWLSVLLSANSHSAINNILAALAEKKEGADGEPELFKLDRWGDDDADEIEGVILVKDYPPGTDRSTDRIYSYADGKPVVLGATCWKIGKSVGTFNRYNNDSFAGFDLIVIDEASQVRTMDAVITLHQGIGAPEERFLIVGDEDQLSPVLKGKYDASDQNVDFYGSVFRLFFDAAKDRGLDYLVPLEEQFRMNEILSRYPARSIYDRDIRQGDGRSGYHAFDFQMEKDLNIASQKLTIAGFAPRTVTPETADDIDLLHLIADPDYPLIVCRIHDGGAKQKRDEEIKLVTKIVRFLRDFMCVPGTDRPYETDEEFWGSSNGDGGVGIISPHHEQINRLKEAIAEDVGMQRDKIFIGTVDKLQGRQREAVIVSYGMTDAEKAAMEMEFIYSRNRLNVAMTRGKKKTVCILSDTLLDRSIETLSVDDENVLKGIDHMTGLLDFMNEEEEDTQTDNYRNIKLGDVKIDVLRKKMKN